MKNFACAFALIWSYHVVRADEPPAAPPAAVSPVEEQRSADSKRLQEKLDELRVLQAEVDRLRRKTDRADSILFQIKIAEVSRRKLAERAGDSSLVDLLTEDSDRRGSARNVLSEAGQKLFDKLRAEQVLRIVSEPAMATLPQRPASMHVGGEVAVPVSDGRHVEFSLDSSVADVQLTSQNLASRVRYLRYGTSIELVPVVLNHQKLRLEFRLKLSHLDFANAIEVDGQKYPSLVSRQIDFGTEIPFGKTMVVVLPPGVKSVSEAEAAADEPSATENDDAKEIVVLVTPRCVDSMTTAQPVTYTRGPTELAVPRSEAPPAPVPFQLPKYRVPQ